jgi:hypothetical protein
MKQNIRQHIAAIMQNITLVYDSDTEPHQSLFCMPANAVWASLFASFCFSDTHAGMATKAERLTHEAKHTTVHSGAYCINPKLSSQSGSQDQTRPAENVSVYRPYAESNQVMVL